MTKICIYDSGIGGLTTLQKIENAGLKCEVLYYADNANHPFGNKTKEQIEDIVCSRISELSKKCDVIVLACNTASTTIDDKTIIKLIPPIDDISPSKRQDTLVLATPRTIENIKLQNDIAKDFIFADTPDLASIIEQSQIAIHLSQNNYNTRLRCDKNLCKYLDESLKKYIGVHNVIIGCSHYSFCKNEIKNVLGNVNFFDGNQALINKLKSAINYADFTYVKNDDNIKIDNIDFEFSGQDLCDVYRKIYADYEKQENEYNFTTQC